MEHNAADNSKTNLIINYLPQTLSDGEFRSIFISVGPLRACKIIRDKDTGYSHGFGFVDYESEVDAQSAIDTLNGYQMQNKTIKVALARHGDNIKGANLYVRNFPKTWSENDLQKYFDGFGNIIQVRVLSDHNTGISKRVGFVLYDQRSEADAACNALNGKVPTGFAETISVKFADDNSKKGMTTHHQPQSYPPFYMPRGAYAGGGGGGGPTRGGRGRGGARFQGPGPGPIRNPRNRCQYNPIAQHVGGGGGGGGHFGSQAGRGHVPNQTVDGHILFIYNIGTEADEKLLWQLFAPCGTVQKVNIIMDNEKGCCKGYGFVTMTNLDEAQYAVECYDGYQLNDKRLQVSFKKNN